ncbi:glutamate-5-semialdehyde dehydrogenase [Actinomyces sp. F1_1611]
MSNQDDVTQQILAIATRSRQAARKLAGASRNLKDGALHAMANALLQHQGQILSANARDLERGRTGGMSEGLLDRLELTSERIEQISDSLLELASLPDPVGEVLRGSTLPNGIRLQQVQVPMGVVGMIYEARPNVTVDAAGLGLKSGNAVILRGGSAAAETNTQIVQILSEAVASVGLPRDAIQSIDEFGRDGAVALMKARGYVDLVVPRGGAGLIQTVVNEAKVPVIETGVGNCHVYVDREVDQDQALAIVINSKTHRPSVCNAAEKLLVHQDRVHDFLPRVLSALSEAGVQLTGDERVRAVTPSGVVVEPAEEDDWACEFLALRAAVRVVDSLDEAIDHISRYSSGHTDAICTTSLAAADRFTAEVDSAVVNINASTRFTDGGQFGLGAEIGISTQKLHARGPMGLAELTTSKWIVHGQGQIRE